MVDGRRGDVIVTGGEKMRLSLPRSTLGKVRRQALI
jgi:hypothetical protein